MINPIAKERIRELHESPWKVVIACTGAGAGVQKELADIPGASKTILDSIFPYSQAALVDFLGGFTPEKFASEDTALRMAAAARARAQELDIRQGGKGKQLIGLGLTASIATDRAKRGENRVHLAAASDNGIWVVNATFSKKSDGMSMLGRHGETVLCDELAVNLILFAAGLEQIEMAGVCVSSKEFAPHSGSGTRLAPRQVTPFASESREELFGKPLFWADGVRSSATDLDPKKYILFGGSFNPLHYGHLRLAREAQEMSGKKVVFSITASHPAKGLVAVEELQKRVEQFRYLAPVLLSEKEGLFVEKAESFRGFSFLIGADTLLGILNPDYYEVEVHELLRIFREELGTHFFVGGRVIDGEFYTLDRVLREKGVAAEHWSLFTPVGNRADVASRTLR